MCGIAGYFGSQIIEHNNITRCLQLMNNRGPDAKGSWLKDDVCLLHTRLRIIDLHDRSDQPMTIGSYTIIFNGEMYNYKEQREFLEDKFDIEFRSDSDTEVFLRLLTFQGRVDLTQLKHAEGMWAFALWNDKEKVLYLGRDRFGEKPLYYTGRPEHGFFFGSEPKFLSALSGTALTVNMDHIKRYLAFGYRTIFKARNLGQTWFKGIYEIAPGCVRIFNRGNTQTILHKNYSYWKPPTDLKDKGHHIDCLETLPHRSLISHIKHTLEVAVHLRLRSDVPLAFCLSGGMDSNTCVAIAKKIHDYNVHGFTIRQKDQRYDESYIVDQVVKDLNIQHTYVDADTGNFLENLTTMIDYHWSPISTISYYVHWLLIKEIARNGYKVSISGTGGDEFFAGYYDHFLYLLGGNDNVPLQLIANWEKHIQPIIRNPLLKDPYLFRDHPEIRDRHLYEASIRFQDAFKFNKDCNKVDDLIWDHVGLLKSRMLSELFYEVVPVVLYEDDLNAMQFSIENRSPLLDSKIFDVFLSIPSYKHFDLNYGYGKGLMREAMRGIIPDCVIDSHKKVGFNAALEEVCDLNEAFSGGGTIWELVDKQIIMSMIGKEPLDNEESKFLFSVLNAKIFLDLLGA